MDTILARTFLEIVAAGSFVAAAQRLHVSQTAVSARVQALEEHLDRRLFTRNRGGARLTEAGQRFLVHASTMIQVWERARQQVALPDGSADLVSLGAEVSLWHPLLSDLLIWLRRKDPDLALRATVDVRSALLDSVQQGALDVAVFYQTETRPELVVDLIAEDKLVMVTTAQNGSFDPASYVFVDFGEDFAATHDAAFPELANPSVRVSLGRLGLPHILALGGSAYLRLSVVRGLLAAGRLFLVPEAPEFSYSVHAAYSTRSSTDAIQRVRAGLRACADQNLSMP